MLVILLHGSHKHHTSMLLPCLGLVTVSKSKVVAGLSQSGDNHVTTM